MSQHQEELPSDARVFVSDEGGPEEYVAFFEDDGATGYLYVSDRRKRAVVRCLQIYANSNTLQVEEQDVRVVWSVDGSKVGVRIFGGMRGIIDIARNVEGRALLENRQSHPISDEEWLRGFR